MNMMILACMLLVAFPIVLTCPLVTFNRGAVSLIGESTDCRFLLNDQEPGIVTTEMLSLRFYGFVRVACADCTTGVVSTFDGCDDCIWCSHNEGIEACRAKAFPAIVSAVITILMTLTSLLLAMKFKLWRKVTECGNMMAMRIHRTKLMKRKHKATKLFSCLQTPVDNENIILVNVPSAPAPSEVSQQPSNSSYIRPTQQTVQADIENHPYLSIKSEKAPELPPRNPNFNKVKAAAGLALLMATSTAKACDLTSYVSSENKIYMDNDYTTLYTGFYMLQSGQILCLKYPNNEVDKLVVQSTEIVEHYTPIYRTSNYSIEVTQAVYRCYMAGECNYNQCLDGKRAKEWRSEKTKPGMVTHYGCIQGNDYCGFCSYYGQCKWYKYTLKPEGGLYTVYRKGKTDWSVHLSYISRSGNINKIILSSGMISSKAESVIISILEPSKPEFHYEAHLLGTTEGSYWNLNANPAGDLSSSLIGDLQIGLYDSNEIAYQVNNINCWSEDCVVRCKVPESGLIRGLRQYRNYTVDVTPRGQDRILKRSTHMSFGLFLTTNDTTALISIPASCSFKVEMTYGCIACSKPTNVVVQATNIKSVGLVEVTSNCSLDRYKLACQAEPQLLTIDYHSSTCELTIPKTNQTLYINIDYIFEGTVYGVVGLISTVKAVSGGEMALQFLSSGAFLTSLTSMVSSMTLLGIGALALRSLTKFLAVRASIKTVRDLKEIT